MLWINFLHLYQPVNADAYHIKEATEKSYLRIIRALEEHSNLKFSFNINGCLFYRWEELGYHDLIARIGKLIKKGQIELCGNAAYHPLLPLIKKEEAKKQIKETEAILRKHFGPEFKPKGFFLSEMAYDARTAKLVKSLGYEWLILDEISGNGKLGTIDSTKPYLDLNSGLKIVFRSRQLSNSYVPETVSRQMTEGKSVAVTATDGELYGLRFVDHSAMFEELLKRSDLETRLISDFIRQEPAAPGLNLVASNWESSEDELANKAPFALWQDKQNEIQTDLWRLADLAFRTIAKHKTDRNQVWARWHLVRGLASCTYWWASGKDFKESFGPLAWSPDEIERGLNELIRSIRSLEDSDTVEVKLRAEKLCLRIRKKVWESHWGKYWKGNGK